MQINSLQLFDVDSEARLAMNLDSNLYQTEQEALPWPEVTPWWSDLIDKEDVSNDGEGVYIAVLDTGLLPMWSYFFPAGNIAWEYGKGFSHDIYWDDTYQAIMMSDLKDDRGFITDLASGHGTHVASTIGGYYIPYDLYVEGIAPKAKIIPVLVLDAWDVATPFGNVQFSGGTNEMIAAGIAYIANLADSLDGPVIINMSLGGPEPSQLIEDAIDYAISKGVIVVVSAGNEGLAGMDYPGAYDQVISCAAGGWTEMFSHEWYGHWFYDGVLADVPEELNTIDVYGNEYQVYLEDFSGRPNATLGQKHTDLDIMAPGAWILGPYKEKFDSYIGYYYVSGTSMAAPHVSAISALILQSYSDFDQKDIEHILRIAAHGVGKNMRNGFPKTGENVIVAWWIPGYGYYVSWGRFDYGTGFLKANEAMWYAAHYKAGHYK